MDELQIDVFAFGILTDFRSILFPGSSRLVELADRMNVLQVEALCWCGKRATHNARTENGAMVVEGEVIVVGDVEQADEPPADVAYEVLCRQHHRRRLTAGAPRPSAWPPSRCPSAEARRPGRPPASAHQAQPTRMGISISAGVREPCRPTSVFS